VVVGGDSNRGSRDIERPGGDTERESGAANRGLGGALEAVLKRDRMVVLAALFGLVVLSWAYLFYLASQMGGMNQEMVLPRVETWSFVDVLALYVMWSVMMVAMMVPSAAPLVLLFANVNRKRQERADPLISTGLFLLGYLLVWVGFSVAATLMQWGLHTAALISPMMVSASPVLGGLLLIAAGLFQWTPIKQACLRYCRSPLGFLTVEWREGRGRALFMGLKHGALCVGCCWALMVLLFVAGVMNLFWIAAIAAFVLIEKLAPRGAPIGLATGAVLMVAGVALLVSSL